ncbi:helix-turn-helix domain-containing protein [Tenacibaculum sp. C7A-26P2]|uniref:helix-turn-helix domain-containing protein n=1 Tax=Tenacibaculum sp. C7A-26P2 TaxID=3447504 RepID=UPI003F827B84
MNASEIKKRRKELGLTQEQLAKKIGITKRTIINYEKGEFIPESKVKLLHSILSNKNEEAIPLDFSELNVMFVPLVNQYAYAGYLSGYGDDEFIEGLSKIPFIADQEHKDQYLCFEVKGDSMDDGSYESYLEGDVLLCLNIRQDYWMSKLHINKWDFVVVHKEKGVLVKRITEHDVENGILTLHSLNEYYDDFQVHLKDVAKIFNIVDDRRKRNRR